MSITEGKLFSNTKEKKSWSRSNNKDGIEREIRIREVENGYLINISVSGNVPKKDKSGDTEYIYKTKEFISKTNPLESEDDKFEKSMNILEESLSKNIEFNNV